MEQTLKRHSILIVESDSTISAFVRDALRGTGFQILTSTGGLDALEILEVAGVDMIILEQSLTEADGFSLYDRLKQDFLTREIPFLFLSDQNASSPDGPEKDHLSSFDGVLTRPFNPSALISKVQTLLSGREAQTRLKRQDTLTGLLNHDGVEQDIKKELARIGRYDRFGSLVLFSIDEFDHLEERFGPITGDTVLITLAELLQRHTRACDFLGRHDNDSFLAYLPESRAASAREMSARLQAAFATAPIGIEGLSPTLSAGIVEADRHNNFDYATLIEHARSAILESRKRGKGQATVWSKAIESNHAYPENFRK